MLGCLFETVFPWSYYYWCLPRGDPEQGSHSLLSKVFSHVVSYMARGNFMFVGLMINTMGIIRVSWRAYLLDFAPRILPLARRFLILMFAIWTHDVNALLGWSSLIVPGFISDPCRLVVALLLLRCCCSRCVPSLRRSPPSWWSV